MNKLSLEREYPAHAIHIRNAFDAKQGHIFRWWNELSPAEKKHLLDQISTIDFPLVKKLFNETCSKPVQCFAGKLVPPNVIPVPGNVSEKEEALKARKLGEDALRRGEVAVLTVAGGDATRLGTTRPKGTIPIAPISGKSFFHLFGERILAAQQRYNTQIPWYIMTSKTNNSLTQCFFHSHRFFGLNSREIYFFTQSMLPVVNLHGKLLMNSKSNIVMSPNGHGGTLLALKESGFFDNMKARGIRHIFYHQVDNVLIKIADPIFIGYHLRDGAELSLKVVRKRYPEEKVGILGYINGQLHVVEYSELSREDMYAKNEDGNLKYNAGNIAIHMINLNFLEKLFQKKEEFLPYHAARKKVPYLDEDGIIVNPSENNAIKFECFIFDILKYVRKSAIMEVVREDEFSPVKNIKGESSPDTARRDMCNLFGRWLQRAGIHIPTDKEGNVIGLIEISPYFAMDEEELVKKVDKQIQFTGCLSL